MVRVDFGGCVLLPEQGAPFEATVRGRLMGRKKALGNTVVVGDVVTVAWEQERAMIEEVEPRRNAFSRRAAGEKMEEQVVAANLDQVVVVASLIDPRFAPGSSIASAASRSTPGSNAARAEQSRPRQ